MPGYNEIATCPVCEEPADPATRPISSLRLTGPLPRCTTNDRISRSRPPFRAMGHTPSRFTRFV